ncbi:MAG TPA: YDG domain-containing protein [Candidatus Binatia bacterium]|jgi:alpha-N-arabinofuranosidase|nr:YDG domain-containing protein [Candidatus Binatia bacterium]
MRARRFLLPAVAGACLAVIQHCQGQANLPIYTDNLVNAFQDWSWNSTRNFANTIPVNSGTQSISVTITSSGGALSLQYQAGFNTSPYASLSFWVNGGSTGGQRLQLFGTLANSGQIAYALPRLPTNQWQQITVPLATLGVANKSNFSGLFIQDTSGGAQPVFYVDDVQLNAAPAPALVHLNVDVTKTNRAADGRWFGINTATWDGNLSQQTTTLGLLQDNGCKALRWPGGSTSDAYHWASDNTGNSRFNYLATNLGAQVFITVNYGSGGSNEAAAWVLAANVTNHCGFKYWEIGNECYGSWENDVNSPAHDPYTYAVRSAGYMQMMRAADPTIRIGMVAVPGEDSYANNTNHPALNPRTGVTHNGWTPVMLATLKSLGVTPDFLIHHVYPEYTNPVNPPPAADSDPLLLQSTVNWAKDAANLRQQVSDYVGSAGTNIELCATENNSDASSAFGRQLTSIVNGLYLVDSACQIMKTEFNSYFWWDLRNGHNSTGTFDPTIYGWRTYGDEGMLDGVSGKYPTFYAEKILKFFVRPGDTVLNPTSDYLLLAAYAARKADGGVSLLVMNKDTVTNFTSQIALSGFVPTNVATVRFYGIPQDDAVRTNNTTPGAQDIATNILTTASANFNYSFPPLSVTVFTFEPMAPPPAATTLALASSGNPSTYGNPVTFTATVRTNGVAVGGITGETVTFYSDGVQLGTGTLNAGGQASFGTTAAQLSAAAHSVTAGYTGDSLYAGSTNSPALAQTVNRATLTPGLTGTVSKNYDGTTTAALAPGNYTLSGVVSGDTVTLNDPATGIYDTRNAGGAKTVTVTGLALSGGSASNYVLSSTSTFGAVGAINKTNLTVTAAANSKPYDRTISAAATPMVTAGNVQAGDTANFTESYDNKNVGTGKMLTPAGSVADGNAGNNYAYSFVPVANGVIVAAGLAVTNVVALDKVYDGTTNATLNAVNAGLAVVLTGDTVSLVASNAAGYFADANVGTNKPVTARGYALAGADAGNYLLAQPTGLMASILPLVAPVLDGISLGAGGTQLTFHGQPGQNYRVLAAGALTLPLSQWTVLASGTFGAGAATSTDPATNLPSRFYRIVSP